MRVGDITEVLERFAPLRIQEDWDNSGLLIGSPGDAVHGVLVGFDCTPELIEEAVEKGCDMVVTHHPLIFKGIRRINADDPVGAAVMLAVRHGVAVYAAHTTADKVIAGVSGAMARRLGLRNISILVPEEDGTVGLGCIGDFPEPPPVCAGEIRPQGHPQFQAFGNAHHPGGAPWRQRRRRNGAGPFTGRSALYHGRCLLPQFLHSGGLHGHGYRPF